MCDSQVTVRRLVDSGNATMPIEHSSGNAAIPSLRPTPAPMPTPTPTPVNATSQPTPLVTSEVSSLAPTLMPTLVVTESAADSGCVAYIILEMISVASDDSPCTISPTGRCLWSRKRNSRSSLCLPSASAQSECPYCRLRSTVACGPGLGIGRGARNTAGGAATTTTQKK